MKQYGNIKVVLGIEQDASWGFAAISLKVVFVVEY